MTRDASFAIVSIHDELRSTRRSPEGSGSRRPREAFMKYVLFYDSAEDVASKAPAQFPAHSARVQEFRARGDLLMVGTFGDPQNEGSMAIFTSREAAEEFVKDDPFVLNGVVRDWHIREWYEVLAP
jgi:uncharacterized protein